MQKDLRETLFEDLKKRLDGAQDEPRYLALAQGLQQAIEDNLLTHGRVLPSERHFSEALSLSRVTVVKALARLAEQGLVVKQQGKGSVVHAPFTYNLAGGSFTAQLSQLGKLSDRWLARELMVVTPELAVLTGMPEGSEIAKIRRVRSINGEPTSIETTYIPKSFLPQPELLEGSLYAHWREQGIEPSLQQYQIRQQMPDQAELTMLGLAIGMPVLALIQHSYSAGGELLEVSKSLCRGDYYSFSFSCVATPQ